MDVFRHDDKRVQLKAVFATISVDSLQEESDVVFDDEEPSALPGLEGDEVSSGWRDQSSRLQERTSAAKAAVFCLA